jgi:probable HAF family extracellular repeat protein
MKFHSLRFVATRRLFVALLSLHLFAAMASAQQQYTVTDLGTLGGNDPFTPEARAINNSGQIVGVNSFGSSTPGFLYSNGVMRGIPLSPFDINEAGQIVGSATVVVPNNSFEHAFIYSDGVLTDLGTLPGNDLHSRGLHINNAGQVTGISWFIFGETPIHSAFLYSNGLMQGIIIGRPSGPRIFDTLDLNDAGQVVGASTFPNVPCIHAFVYSGGTVKDIGALPGGACSSAQAINNRGEVAGVSRTNSSSSVEHLFLYSGGVMQDLGSLGGEITGGLSHVSMNNSGQIVGFYWPENSNSFSAFLYSDGVLTDLNSLIPADSGWVLKTANDINEYGQIVGWGFLNGERRPFLLTPATPLLLTEPNSNKAIALDSVTFVRDPFPVVTEHNFSTDHRTRILLFARYVTLAPGEPASVLTAQAEGPDGVYPLTVEHFGPVPGLAGLTQIVVRLPDELDGGDVQVSIALKGTASNKGTVSIKPTSAGSQ